MALKLELAGTALFVCSSLIGGLATWGAVWLSHKTGILDKPGGRKIHDRPIAYLGGLGFTVTVILSLVLWALLAPVQAFVEMRLASAVVLGLVATFLVGLWDDVAGMRASVKLGFQLLVAAGLWWAGVRIERVSIQIAGSPLELGGPMSLLLTMGWYAVVINAINLIDGLDGLAGGVTLIGSVSLGIVAGIATDGAFGLGVALPLAAAGGALGFLVHNWHPASIFLGDSGSMAIGYVLATGALISSTKAPALLTLLVPMVALGLPIFESVYSFLRRAATGQSPFKADRRHLHHRLLDAGLTQRRVVFVFLFATAYLGINSILLAQARSIVLLLNVVLLGVGLGMLIEYLGYFERRREANGQATPLPHDGDTG